jgi:hypothetical protein
MEMSGQLRATATFPPGKVPHRHPLNMKFGGFQSRFGSFGEEKDPMLRPGIELRFLGYHVRSLVTIPTTLPGSQLDDSE